MEEEFHWENEKYQRIGIRIYIRGIKDKPVPWGQGETLNIG